ncbi:probable UDP-3-O-acyl-N-acetylglucosamine deacetylase 1, mitochondrial isoform X2 [Malania oleifera]|uniref:probable UDP-3-O-acyl-N-acetylglucosamine deacetylase 1, mitochondrial isoform X2 n=1 Tax=Malania oleifera TaxID=397392 RepID=UPI0025AE8CA3|nr:probable UDP-3-O-acyl-N-acetylglucosamine deacetylase 1, mitochondrial isoform X2 [Malania oleifera]
MVRAFQVFKRSPLVSWKSTGKLQQTLGGCIERSGKTLHSGKVTKVKLWPEFAGAGRYFNCRSGVIPASVDVAVETPLCTKLCKDGRTVQTVEHLLSALEAASVDNCRIEIESSHSEDPIVEDLKTRKTIDIGHEVPILDGSAMEWVEAIEQAGVKVATDQGGRTREKMVPFLNEALLVWKDDSFIAAFPSSNVNVTYLIDFPQVPAIGCQWFSSAPLDESFYAKQIASSRTFCIFEELERMQNAGLIRGGSLENAIVCSSSKGWLNPPLHFHDEPCRHKVLDLIGDLSLCARHGSQGIPVAHIVAYKGGHSLHIRFARRLLGAS